MSKISKISTAKWVVNILTIVFVILKATHSIEWAWIWVFSPLWVYLVAKVAVYTLLATIDEMINRRIGRR